MKDHPLPIHPLERYQRLRARMSRATPTAFQHHLHQDAEEFKAPLVNVLGQTVSFVDIILDELEMQKERVPEALLNEIHTHFPHDLEDPVRLARLLVLALAPEETTSTAVGILRPELTPLLAMVGERTASKQQEVSTMAQRLLMSRMERDLGDNYDRAHRSWSEFAWCWLTTPGFDPAHSFYQPLQAAAVQALVVMARLSDMLGARPQTSVFIADPQPFDSPRSVVLEPALQDLLESSTGKPEAQSVQLTLMARFAVGLLAVEPENATAQEALGTFHNQLALVEKHFPFIERQSVRRAFDSLMWHVEKEQARQQAQKMDQTWTAGASVQRLRL